MSVFRSAVPPVRVRALNRRPPRPGAGYVLYWMTAYRRTTSNFALQRAAEWARHLGIPLVVLSAVRVDYRWASDRLHAPILDGIADVQRSLVDRNVAHLGFVEQIPGQGRGLLEALAEEAAVVVADDAPVFFLPQMVGSAAERVGVLMEGIDHNGLMPIAATDRVFLRAHDLRRFLQRELPVHLQDSPARDPLVGLPPPPTDLLDRVIERWPSPPVDRALVGQLPIDHTVAATPLIGGEHAAVDALDRFVARRLGRYLQRNHPDVEASSGLSAYLHFGNISPHYVFDEVAASEGWSIDRLGDRADGGRTGWWGMSPSAEAFLDQLVTWRELGHHAAARVVGNASYTALPKWARQTLADHAGDPREYVYRYEDLDAADTHDDIWNAAQRRLREEGTIHSYLRMLWGKKILEWTRSPQEAHRIMFDLNDRYAIDGRDPNSISGIHWVFGRYDRPWGPERSVFGKVRYMSSDATRRKLRMRRYLDRESALVRQRPS